MSLLHTGNGTITYEAVRQALEGEPYRMSLTDTDEIQAIIQAVNQGIDSHLEACFCPDRGDRFEGDKRMVGTSTLCHTLECSVSCESLPVLLRRLFELDTDDDAAAHLAGDILLTLGFHESA